jgi:1-acylglycerone phosphate reductase
VSSLVPYPLGSTYAVTKAAVLHYSNCLRVELAPFGVDVVTLQLGRIDTGFSGEIYIAPDSLYKDATETLSKKKDFAREGGSDNVEMAVEQILKSVLTTNPPANYYLGVGMWPGWLIGYVFPTSFGDYLTSYFWQFDKFAKRIRDKK